MLSISLFFIAGLGACGEQKSHEHGDHDDHHDHHDHDDDSLPDDFDPATEWTTNHGVTVSYTTYPSPIPDSQEFAVIFTVSEGSIVGADGTMPTHGGHGMNVEPQVIDNEDGTFTAEPFEFHMPGYWEIHATVESASGSQERLDFQVDCCE